MIKSYIKIAFRNLVRYKSFSLINILGLAIGLSASLLIALWVFDELSYDKFHENSKQIYRVERHINWDGQVFVDEFCYFILKFPKLLIFRAFTQSNCHCGIT